MNIDRKFLYRFKVEFIDKQNGMPYEVESSIISTGYATACDKMDKAIKEYVEFEEDEYKDIISVNREDIGSFIGIAK